MLKRDITYTNFDEKKVTETHHFHLSMADLIELDMNTNEGLQKWATDLVEANARGELYSQFKKILLSAYGEKSDDGRSFVKTPEIQEAFSHTGAFHQLIFDICTDLDFLNEFLLGCFPAELRNKAKSALGQQQDKPKGPPRPPSPPVSLA